MLGQERSRKVPARLTHAGGELEDALSQFRPHQTIRS
jgi:hypothetical protein